MGSLTSGICSSSSRSGDLVRRRAVHSRLGGCDGREDTLREVLLLVGDASGTIDDLEGAIIADYDVYNREGKKIEASFAELMRKPSLTRHKARGLGGAHDDIPLTATVRNLRRLGNAIWLLAKSSGDPLGT